MTPTMSFRRGNMVSVSPMAGRGVPPALLDVVGLPDARTIEMAYVKGTSLSNFFLRDSVLIVLDGEDSNLVAQGVVVDVSLPSSVKVRLTTPPELRARRDNVRIDDHLCLEIEVHNGSERSVLEEFRARAPRKAPIQLTPPGRFTQKEDRDILEELQKEVLKRIVDLDMKMDAVIRFLAGGERKALLSFTPQWVNLSGSGFRFMSEETLKSGDFLDVKLHLPDGGGVPIEMLAVVIRSDATPQAKGGRETAVHFRYIDEDDRDRLIRYIFSRQRESIRIDAAKQGARRGV